MALATDAGGTAISRLQTKIIVLWWRHASKKRSGTTCANNTKPPLDLNPLTQKGLRPWPLIVAQPCAKTPHETKTTQITISEALRYRAESVINDRSIDPQWRNIVRYALEINDPLLPDVVRRAAAGERIIDTANASQITETNEADPSREKIEALADIICGAGRESAAALFVLMGTLEDATDPQTFAHTAKHFAFTRCGELNVFGMVDAQIAVLEGALLV